MTPLAALAVLVAASPLSERQLEEAIEKAQRSPAIADRIEQIVGPFSVRRTASTHSGKEAASSRSRAGERTWSIA
jgi:hypothetical protein